LREEKRNDVEAMGIIVYWIYGKHYYNLLYNDFIDRVINE